MFSIKILCLDESVAYRVYSSDTMWTTPQTETLAWRNINFPNSLIKHRESLTSPVRFTPSENIGPTGRSHIDQTDWASRERLLTTGAGLQLHLKANSKDVSNITPQNPGFKSWRLCTLLAAPPVRCKLPVFPTLGKPLYHGETDFPQ